MVHKAPSHKPYRRNAEIDWPKTPGRLLGLGLIRLYQLTLSSWIGQHCRHMPTCSEFTYEAVARFGLWTGGWMGLFRVLRCGPGGTHGINRVPLQLEPDYHWYKFWQLWKISARKQSENL